MFPYVLSPDVLQDLQEIWDFIAANNVSAADKLEDEFFEAFEVLAKHPGMGHARSDLTERDVRFWPVGSYLIVCRTSTAAPIQIVAVLHGARDVADVIRKR